MTFLLTFTFVFGVLRLLTLTKLFDLRVVGIFDAILPLDGDDKIYPFLHWLQTIIFYFSLCFQAWYWIFQS